MRHASLSLLPAPQTDIRMPRRQLRQLEDAHFNGAFAAAIEAAVQARCWWQRAAAPACGSCLRLQACITAIAALTAANATAQRCLDACPCLSLYQAVAAGDRDVRVLNLGAGAGLHAMTALRAGAHHVTAVERWLYLALACKESLAANKASWLVQRGGQPSGHSGVRPTGETASASRPAISAPSLCCCSFPRTAAGWRTSAPQT